MAKNKSDRGGRSEIFEPEEVRKKSEKRNKEKVKADF